MLIIAPTLVCDTPSTHTEIDPLGTRPCPPWHNVASPPTNSCIPNLSAYRSRYPPTRRYLGNEALFTSLPVPYSVHDTTLSAQDEGDASIADGGLLTIRTWVPRALSGCAVRPNGGPLILHTEYRYLPCCGGGANNSRLGQLALNMRHLRCNGQLFATHVQYLFK